MTEWKYGMCIIEVDWVRFLKKECIQEYVNASVSQVYSP